MDHLVPGFTHRLSAQTYYPTEWLPLVWPYHCPSEEEPPFPNGGSDEIAVRLLDGLGVQEVGGVVGMTLEGLAGAFPRAPF